MDRQGDLIREMFVARLDTASNDLEISGCKSLYHQDVTLESLLFNVFPSAQREV